MRLYNLWPSDDGGHVWHGMWKVRKEKVSMATKREALIPQGIWWWTLSFSLHTLWMDPTIKILVDNQGTFTPVESKVLFHSLRCYLCWESIPLPDAGSHLVSMCAFKMHTCAHKRKKKRIIQILRCKKSREGLVSIQTSHLVRRNCYLAVIDWWECPFQLSVSGPTADPSTSLEKKRKILQAVQRCKTVCPVL